MILLHAAAAVLYALAAWSLWPEPVPAAPAAAPRPEQPSRTWTSLLIPAALLLHAWLVWSDVATPEGLDVSFLNATSAVTCLVAAVAWGSGLLRTLPAIATLVLPVAAAAVLLSGLLPAMVPGVFAKEHRFAYGGEFLATAHIAVALVASALIFVAALQALLLMGLEKRLHRRLPDPGASGLPPLLTLERFLFRIVTTGFLLLTVTVVSGMLFSERIFGKPVMFTHKDIFSVLGWLTIGGLLWGRWRYGWRGRKALWWIIAGTVFVFLAYLGSKFVLEVLLHR